jgi:hypothetical protein
LLILPTRFAAKLRPRTRGEPERAARDSIKAGAR